MTHAELQEKMAQWEQEQEEARIAAEIKALEAEMKLYISAKNNVANVQNDCNSETSNLNSNIVEFGSKIEEIVKVDSFEGEIAKQLKSHATNLKSDLDEVASSAENLGTALGSQIAKIALRIDEIETKIRDLQSQI